MFFFFFFFFFIRLVSLSTFHRRPYETQMIAANLKSSNAAGAGAADASKPSHFDVAQLEASLFERVFKVSHQRRKLISVPLRFLSFTLYALDRLFSVGRAHV
jgi:hypothetical protein